MEGRRHRPVMVPVPVYCSVSVTEGSTKMLALRGRLDEDLSRGDKLRISHPYYSDDFPLSSDPEENFSRHEITLARAYTRSSIEREQMANSTNSAREATVKRLYSSRERNKSHGQGDKLLSPSPSKSIRKTKIPQSLDDARLWKLVPSDLDHRPPWRRQYDDGIAPPISEITECRKNFHCFGVSLSAVDLNYMCRDVLNPNSTVHQQRVFYFDRVPLDLVVRETYCTVCKWHPENKTLDIVKWSKLARRMKFLACVSNSNHEIDMAFLRHCHDRKLGLCGFRQVLQNIAAIQYPQCDLLTALKTLLWKTVVMLPHVNQTIWSEAKWMAMAVEGRRVCAQIRLATNYRRTRKRLRYTRMLGAATCIATYWRRMAAIVKKKKIMDRVMQDNLVRRQHASAVALQTEWRRYFCRKKYLNHRLHLMREEEMRREKLRLTVAAIFERRRGKLLMKRAFCFSGVCLGVVVIFNGSVVSMKVYEIAKQKRKVFCFNQRQLRSLMNGISRCDGSHCWNEMLQPNALEQLLERILVRIVNGQTYIPFRQGVRGSGILLLTMAIRNQRGGAFALSIYHRPEEYIFRVYDPQSYCSMLYGTSELDLLKWLFEDMKHFRRRCGPCTKLQETQKRKELCMWLSKIIYIEEDPKVGFQRILLQREADKERANRLACRVQTLFRSLAARARSRLLLRRDYEKVFDRNYRAYYYTNKTTGAWQWTKPLLLGDDDLDMPNDEWRRIETREADNNNACVYYHNPATGQTSWLCEENAAKLLQRSFRRFLAVLLGANPSDFATVVRAVTFVRDAEPTYHRNSRGLAHMVNYALICHCFQFDYCQARILYEKALRRCPSHPIIARAYALLLLAMCNGSVGGELSKTAIARADSFLLLAEANDRDGRTFRAATEKCFLWAVVVHPYQPRALHNSALLHHLVLRDFSRARRLYRRALVLDPESPEIYRNFQEFESNVGTLT